MKIIILGEPLAKQSFRFTRSGHKYQDKDLKDWEGQAKVQLAAQLPEGFRPFQGPVVIKNLTFVFPITKGCPKYKRAYIEAGNDLYKETKPDLMDNLPKNVFDVCNGILFTDDSNIVAHRGELKKIYGLRPRIEFEIEPLEYDFTNFR